MASSISARWARTPAPGEAAGIMGASLMGRRSAVTREMGAVVVERVSRGLAEPRGGGPAQRSGDEAPMGGVVADVDALPLGGELAPREAPAAVRLDQHLGQPREAHALEPAEIEHPPRGAL